MFPQTEISLCPNGDPSLFLKRKPFCFPKIKNNFAFFVKIAYSQTNQQTSDGLKVSSQDSNKKLFCSTVSMF
jgi:hypothetical protein